MVIDRRTAILGMAAFAAAGTSEALPADKVESSTHPATERVLGIGGLFFRSRDPKQLAQWYQVHHDIYPVPTDYSHQAWQQAAGPTAFSPFSMDTKYLGPPRQMWMITSACAAWTPWSRSCKSQTSR